MKALYILDYREGGLVLYGHDLDDDLVETLVAEYQSQGKYAYSVDQTSAHGGQAQVCEKCRRAGERIASGTMAVLQTVPEGSETPQATGAIGMVSEEVQTSKRKLPDLGKPVLKLFNLLPILAALGLLGYGVYYLMKTGTTIEIDNQNRQLPSLLTSPVATQTDQGWLETLVPTPTRTPSVTPTRPPTSSVEPVMVVQATITQVPSCQEALSITAEHAGETLCVQGVVYRAEQKEGYFSITFSKEWGNFFLLSYDRAWEQAQPGVCIQVTGEVALSGTIPVMVFGYRNDLSLCP